MTLPASLIGHAAMLTYSALVAFSFTFGDVVADDIDPAVLTTLRFIIAAAALSLIATALRSGLRDLWISAWRWVILGGLSAAYFITMFEALRITTTLSTAAVFTLSPLLATAVGFGLGGARPDRLLLVALSLGGIGALWVIFRADIQKLLAFEIGRGEVLFFFGTLSLAAVPGLTRRLAPGVAPFTAAFGTIIGALGVTAIYAAPDIVQTDIANLPTAVWLVALYLGLFTTAATFFLLQVAIPRLSPGKVMAYTYLVPSWVILHQIVLGRFEPVLVYVGVLFTLAALVVLLMQDLDRRSSPRRSHTT
ncbi:MAG: DMT family transporter [Pseudomonadota bacterium]